MFPNNHAVETGAVGDPDPRKKHFVCDLEYRWEAVLEQQEQNVTEQLL